MPKYCASGLCKNNARDNPEKKFALFVQIKGRNADVERAKEWVRLMGRSATEFTIDYIKNYTYVCEDHFDKDVELDYRKVSLSISILNLPRRLAWVLPRFWVSTTIILYFFG